jgi:hypothetical protein
MAAKLCHFETSAAPTQQKFSPEIPSAIRRDWLKMVALSQGPGSKTQPLTRSAAPRLPTFTLRAAQNYTLDNVRWKQFFTDLNQCDWK